MQFVSASRGDGHVLSTRIAGDGTYALDHLAPGDWYVRPSEADFTNMVEVASAPPDPANRLVTIVDGSTTRVDLPLPAKSGSVLEGRLLMPGVEDGLWTAHIKPVDNSNSGASAPVGPEGSFHLETLHGGTHHLCLRTVSSQWLSVALDCDIELAPGPNAWEFSTPLGAISASSPPVRDLLLEWRSPSGVTWTAQWRPTHPQLDVLGSVPAGRLRVSGGGRLLAEVEVRAREVTPIVWN
jgi:hypothetical protein